MKNRIETLRNLLQKALADKGIVYIPAFALGLEITEIYSSFEPYWDQEAKDLSAKGDHPLDFKGLYAVRKYQDHQKLCSASPARPLL